MDSIVAIVLIAIAVLGLGGGMAYYAINQSRQSAILAESEAANGQIREVADIIRNLALSGQESAKTAYQYSYGYVELMSDGVTVVKATLNGQTSTLTAAPHQVFAYVGQYSMFNSIPFYPLGGNDSAIATTPTVFVPIYEYSQDGYSYIVASNRVYVETIQTQPTETDIQLYLIEFNSTFTKAPPAATIAFTASTDTNTFTYDVSPDSTFTLAVASGTLQQTLPLQFFNEETLRIQVNTINLQLSYQST
jgi:hypothetical protein